MSKIKLLKGLASLFQKKKPKKTEKFGPPRDPERDYETAAALKKSRKLYDLERKNLSPLQDELNKMLKAEQTKLDDSLNQLKVATFEMEEMGKALDEFNRIADEDGIEAALEAFEGILNPKRTLNADGGRIELGIGGAASGIMQAIKLAAKGIKPFGQKQTYKQNVTMKGVSPDQFDEIYKKQLNRVPDEVVDQPTGEGLKFSLDEAEDILTGVKLGLLTQPQRTKLATAIRDKVAKQIDNPVSGLNNDYLEYMDDALGRMDDLLEIEKLGGDLTPKPVKGAPEFIQTDFTQLNRLRDQGKDNIIPFKPRDKKFKGGLMGLLKRVNPILEKEMVKPKIPVGPQRTDAIGDMEQIKNVSRSGDTGLEGFARMEDMIQESPRYNETMKAMFMKLIDYEKFRANLLDDNAKLQKMMRKDPEGTEAFLKLLFREEGSVSGFQMGGLIPPQKGPMSEGMGTLYRSK